MKFNEIHLSLIELCPLNCSHCYENKSKKFLSRDEWIKIIDIIYANWKPKNIILLGGEPLAHPQVEDILAYAISRCKVCSVQTSGVLPSYFQNYNCEVNVSFESCFKEENDKIRKFANSNQSVYELAVKKMLAGKKYDNPRIARFCLYNDTDVLASIVFAEKLGANLTLVPLMRQGCAENLIHRIPNAQKINEAIRICMEANEKMQGHHEVQVPQWYLTNLDLFNKYKGLFLKQKRICLPYNENILIEFNGKYQIKKIGEIVNNKIECNVPSLNLNNFQIEFKPIINWFSNGKKKIVNITSEFGKEINLTEEHPILVLDDKGDLKWKLAKELTNSDFLISYKKLPTLKKWCSKKHDELWLEGFYVAEGSASKYRNKISQEKKDIYTKKDKCYYFIKRLLKKKKLSIWKASEIASKKFNLSQREISRWIYQNTKPKTLEREWVGHSVDFVNYELKKLKKCSKILKKMGFNPRRGFKNGRWISVRMYGKRAYKWAERFGIGSINKHFIEDRLAMSKCCIKSMLNGYLCGDGCLIKPNKKNYQNFKRKMYYTSSKILRNQLFLAHLILGEYSATLNGRKNGFAKYDNYPIEVFMNKNNNIYKYVPTSLLKKINFNLPYVSKHGIHLNKIGGDAFSEICNIDRTQKHYILKKNKRIKKQIVYKIIDNLRKKMLIEPKKYEYIKNILDSNLLFIQIKNIKKEKEEEVFDLEIKGNHNFIHIPSGFILHNCPAGLQRLFISSNASVKSCMFLPQINFGNLLKDKISKIENNINEFNNKIREIKPQGKCKGCDAFPWCHGGCIASYIKSKKSMGENCPMRI